MKHVPAPRAPIPGRRPLRPAILAAAIVLGLVALAYLVGYIAGQG